MIPRQSLVPGAVHPVIVLQVADDRFQTGPSGGQPLEPGGLFVRTLGLSLAGNRHLGNVVQEVRFPFLLAPVSPVRRQPLRKGSCGLYPILQSLSQGRRVMPVVRIFPMGHHEPVGIDRQGDLQPVFMPLARLVLGDAGDMRLVSAVDPLVLCRTFLDPVDGLRDHPPQNPALLRDFLHQAGQGLLQRAVFFSPGLRHGLPGIPERFWNPVDGPSGKGEELFHALVDPLLLVLAELRHGQDRLPAHPDKATQPLGNGNPHRLHLLDQAGQTNPPLLKKPRVGRIGDVFFHRRGIHPHGRRDPLVVSELLPDERLDLLRSFRSQT